MKTTPAFLAASWICAAASWAMAQTSYPMLMSLDPVAAQVGQTSQHTIRSRYTMAGAYQVLVSGEGVTGEVVPPEIKDGDTKPVETLQVRFTVAPDAALGVRDFRIVTPQGASTLGQVVIVRDPVIQETSDNNTPEQAQPLVIPAAVCGAIEKAEDVDYFKFTVEAGASLSFHVRSMRLQDKIHDLQQHADPILTLRSATGATLAASDNHFYGDPLITYTFEHAGDYLLEIRDVRYHGNQFWQYCIEISDRPLVTNVFPLGVAPGSDTRLELIGYHLPADAATTLTLGADAAPGPAWLPLPWGDGHTNPAPVVIADTPLITEAAGDNNTPASAQPITVPAGVNGRLESEGDMDCYVFEAKKGEKFSLEVIARRQQSSLDSHLRLLNENGQQLQVNDDFQIGKRRYADSGIDNWTAPADGKYVVELRDLHLRGGASFVYFLKITRSEPCFELYADTDKTLLAPGASSVIFVRAVRKNGFDGEVQLAVTGLPPGVTADCGRILGGKGQDGCIFLHAAPDAPMGAANITITGTAVLPNEDGSAREITAVALPYQEIYLPGGGRGHWPVEMHTVSVGAPGDVRSVTLSTYEITLKRGESKSLDVTVERAEGFDKNITLDVAYRHLNSVYGDALPEGVTLDAGQSQTLLTGGAVQGRITLTAAANTPLVERQLVPVMAHVSINFVMKTTFAARPLVVTVTE